MNALYDLPFDQFQRYQLVSTLVEELRPGGEALEILDVGGRTALLRRFLRKDRVTLVDLEPSSEKRLVLGDGSALPFADASFDLVCAFDTLEHVPPAARARFLRECARVARRWVVVAGPYQTEEVEEAEKLLQQFLRKKLGVSHRYLEEHRHHGLPDRAATEQQFQELGARVVSLGHGNLQRWLALISLALYMDHTPALQAQAVRLHRFYNRGLFDEDEDPPVYRHAVVAALGDARLPRPRRARTHARPPARELVHFAQELAAFDAQRDGHQAELERLASVVRDLTADLAGHRGSLQELRERRDESEAVLATLRADLEGHRRSLKELLDRRKEAESVLATLRADLEGHRRSLQESNALREEAQAVIATLQDDLAGHRGTLAQLSHGIARYEELLAEHRAVLREREQELERHGPVLRELRANIAALDAERAKLLGLRESEGREFHAVRSELQREIGALRTVRGELERQHQGIADELRRLQAESAAAEARWQAERREFESVIAGRDAELGRRGKLQDALQQQLAEHRSVLAQRERELAEHRQVAADLGADLAGHRALVAAQQVEIRAREEQLAGRARELEEARVLYGATQAELANAREQLADLRGALERARGEITAAAGSLEQQQRLIGLLRTELKSRLRSLRRALGPARPTPGE